MSTSRPNGQPLPETARSFFEPRFEHDFSKVRVHTGERAASAAEALNAEAFTYSDHIVFGQGYYNPDTPEGKMLLAHELAHTLQENGAPRAIRRRVKIKEPLDPNDPAAGIDPIAVIDMMDGLVKELGSGFEAVGCSAPGGVMGEIVATGRQCGDPYAVSTGTKAVGNCCLCIMTGTTEEWTVRLHQYHGASTVGPPVREITIPPSTSPAVSGHFTETDVRVMRPRVITFAHELCGHGALFEVKAHPAASPDRVTGTRHDPSVLLEQEIWGEQGLPASTERGLASGPIHRGESFTRIVVEDFPFNVSEPAGLPKVERDKIDLAVTLAYDPMRGNNRWVDIRGHSDPIGSSAAKQQISDQRAQKVQQRMENLGVPRLISQFGVSGDRFTDVRGMSDSEPLPGEPHEKWRRAEIFLATFPAGAESPIPGTPTSRSPTTPEGPLVAGDDCVNLLIEKAWGPGAI